MPCLVILYAIDFELQVTRLDLIEILNLAYVLGKVLWASPISSKLAGLCTKGALSNTAASTRPFIRKSRFKRGSDIFMQPHLNLSLSCGEI